MAREVELLDPVADWIYQRFSRGRILLTYAEPQGRGGRRPDLLAVFAERGHDSVDEVTIIPVEIECSSRAALHDPRNGLMQLRKYPGHAKYLAIPRTVAVRWEAREIPIRCQQHGVGYLVVDLDSADVSCEVEPSWTNPSHGLRYYPKVMERWVALRDSRDFFRRIQGRRIIERD